MPRTYFVYILTNAFHTVLYTGVTNDLHRRLFDHQSGRGSRFVRRYNAKKLVYYEVHEYIDAAIAREKQIKAGSRHRKIELINELNPNWDDLSGTLEAW